MKTLTIAKKELKRKINPHQMQLTIPEKVSLKGTLLPITRRGNKAYILSTKSGQEYLVKLQADMYDLFYFYGYQEVLLKGVYDSIDQSVTVHTITPIKPKKIRWFMETFESFEEEKEYFEDAFDCA